MSPQDACPPLNELLQLDAAARRAILTHLAPLGELRDRTRQLRHLLVTALERIDELEDRVAELELNQGGYAPQAPALEPEAAR